MFYLRSFLSRSFKFSAHQSSPFALVWVCTGLIVHVSFMTLGFIRQPGPHTTIISQSQSINWTGFAIHMRRLLWCHHTVEQSWNNERYPLGREKANQRSAATLESTVVHPRTAQRCWESPGHMSIDLVLSNVGFRPIHCPGTAQGRPHHGLLQIPRESVWAQGWRNAGLLAGAILCFLTQVWSGMGEHALRIMTMSRMTLSRSAGVAQYSGDLANNYFFYVGLYGFDVSAQDPYRWQRGAVDHQWHLRCSLGHCAGTNSLE